MQMLLNALLLAVLLPAAQRTAATPSDEPACRAELKGTWLTTTIEFNDGYRLQAPWKVLSSQHLEAKGDLHSIVADLLLENLIESDALTGKELQTSLAEPIRLRLQAPNEPGLVYQAAETWCSTVISARRGNTALDAPPSPKPGRIT